MDFYDDMRKPFYKVFWIQHTCEVVLDCNSLSSWRVMVRVHQSTEYREQRSVDAKFVTVRGCTSGKVRYIGNKLAEDCGFCRMLSYRT